MSDVEVSDGISDAEVALVAEQLERIETFVPDLTGDGRCMEHLSDPAVAESAVQFASWDALAVLSLVPGIHARGVWGYAVDAFVRLSEANPA